MSESHSNSDLTAIDGKPTCAGRIAALEAENARLRNVVDAARKLRERIRDLAEFYEDLDDAPDGAVPAWDLVGLALDESTEALAALDQHQEVNDE